MERIRAHEARLEEIAAELADIRRGTEHIGLEDNLDGHYARLLRPHSGPS